LTGFYKSSQECFKCCESRSPSPMSSHTQVKYISKGDRTEEVLKENSQCLSQAASVCRAR